MALGSTVSLAYSYTNGRLTGIDRTGADTQSYTISYQPYGTLSGVNIGSRTLATYVYGVNNGPLSYMTYGNGQSVGYVYDHLERVTGVRYNNSAANALTYTYWGEGKVKSLTDSVNGRSYSYGYDTRGRLTSAEEKYGSTTVRTWQALYDTADRPTQVSYWLHPDWSATQNDERRYCWEYSSADGSLTKYTVYCNVYPEGKPLPIWISSFHDITNEPPLVIIY